MAAGPDPTETAPTSPPPVPVYFVADRRASAPRRWATPCSCSSRTSSSSATASRSSPRSREARKAVEILDAAMKGPRQPLVFTTDADDDDQRRAAHEPRADHRLRRPRTSGSSSGSSARAACTSRPGVHGVGDLSATTTGGWQAVEYAIEHDDGESLRALRRRRRDPAGAVALRQDADDACTSRCSTACSWRTTRWSPRTSSARPARPGRGSCATAASASSRRRSGSARCATSGGPDSTYASIEQCRWELRRAELHVPRAPHPDRELLRESVEEMSTVILQHLDANA